MPAFPMPKGFCPQRFVILSPASPSAAETTTRRTYAVVYIMTNRRLAPRLRVKAASMTEVSCRCFLHRSFCQAGVAHPCVLRKAGVP
jgi:hypothetical protein